MASKTRFKKAFSVLSWNVKHFRRRAPELGPEQQVGADQKSGPERQVGPIVDFIAERKPDVLAIYEVVGAQVFAALMEKMPGYRFFVTEGEATQKILLGVKRRLPAFFTQKLEFQSGQSTLRPGALLTLKARGELYTLLFLHLKSMRDPKGFGLRDDMTERALRFYSHLQQKTGGPVNYLFLGDLNTMGMNLTYSDGDMNAACELERLQARAEKRGMRLLEKSHPATYWPGSKSSLAPADLDHVVAAEHVRVKRVKVLGWPEAKTDRARDAWVRRYSDHGGIWLEVGD